jgi:DNA-binding transcriptional MerR regulator
VTGSGSPHARAHLSIGEVLSLLQDEFPDVTISKIRFLESQGLLDPERTPSGYRKFYDYDIERLRWILRLQKDHYLPLKVIKDRLDEAGGMLPFTDGSELAEIERQPSLLTTDVPPGPRELPESQAPAPEAPAAPEVPTAPAPAARAPSQARAMGGDAAVRNGQVAVTERERERERERNARPAGPAASAAPAAPSSRPGTPGPRTGAPGSGRPPSTTPPPAGRAPQDRRPAPGGRDPAGGGRARGGTANGRAVPASPGGPGQGGPGGPGRPGGPGEPGGAGPGGPRGSSPQQRARQQGGGPAGRGGAPRQGGPGERPAPRRNPPSPAPARSRAPEPSANGTVGGYEPVPDAVNLTLDELAEASGLTPRDVRDLERFGLIEARSDAGGGYDGDALVIARTAAGFLQHGIEARHMRTYKVSVDREAGLFEQIVSPLLKQRNPEARVRATRTVTELIRLGEVMRGVLLRRELRDHIGGG